MRIGLQAFVAECASAALDRMNAAEDGVDRLRVVAFVTDGGERLLHAGQAFFAFLKEKDLNFICIHGPYPFLCGLQQQIETGKLRHAGQGIAGILDTENQLCLPGGLLRRDENLKTCLPNLLDIPAIEEHGFTAIDGVFEVRSQRSGGKRVERGW